MDSLPKFQQVFKDKILPLLQDPSHNNYEKIGAALGDAFVQSKAVEPTKVFAAFNNGNGLADEYASRLFHLKYVMSLKASDFISIYS